MPRKSKSKWKQTPARLAAARKAIKKAQQARMLKLKSHTLNAQAQAQVPDSSNLVREGVDSRLCSELEHQELRMLRQFFAVLRAFGDRLV